MKHVSTQPDDIAVVGHGSRRRLRELRRRALEGAVAALADDEVLALALDGLRGDALEIARRLLRQDGLLGIARLPPSELGRQVYGSSATARLLAMVDLVRRLAQARLHHRPRLDRPEAIMEIMAPLSASLAHETLWCLPLDPHCRLIGQPRVVSVGDVDGTDAGARCFFRIALVAAASTVVAVHNHPTGDPAPSAADRLATTSLARAGQTVGIAVQDHVIVGDGGRFISLRRDHPDLWR